MIRRMIVAFLTLWTLGNAQLDDCVISLVESIPEGLEYSQDAPSHRRTYDTWMELVENAKDHIDIASFYWTLRGQDVPSSGNASRLGEEVFAALLNQGIQHDTKIRIVQNKVSKINPGNDTKDLARTGAAEVVTLDFDKIVGGGVLHTKFWIVDGKHAYIGSANMDFRALNEVKEMGLVVYNCSSFVMDLKKIFEVYWLIGTTGEIPKSWPANFSTQYNSMNPLEVNLNQTQSKMFISSSPPPFSPPGREDDLHSIVETINDARKFVYVAVMDFVPLFLFGDDRGKLWLPLETALKKAAVERRVDVRLLVSEWESTRPQMKAFVASLGELRHSYKLHTKKFIVPPAPNNQTIPFTRVNHNKYMVTDKSAFIGTSNWSGDYFTQTAGVGIHIENKEVIDELKAVFLRDWNSQYSHYIYDN